MSFKKKDDSWSLYDGDLWTLEISAVYVMMDRIGRIQEHAFGHQVGLYREVFYFLLLTGFRSMKETSLLSLVWLVRYIFFAALFPFRNLAFGPFMCGEPDYLFGFSNAVLKIPKGLSSHAALGMVV